MTIKIETEVSAVTGVLLADGWHDVVGGIEIGPHRFLRADEHLHTNTMAVRWKESSGAVIVAPVEAVLAVKTAR